MTGIVGRLKVVLGLETAAFETGTKRAISQADAMGNKMQAMGLRVSAAGKAMALAGSALAGTAIGMAIRSAITDGLAYASALGEQARQLGVTTAALQEYRYMATQTGIEQGVMDASLARLTRTMGDAAAGAKGPAAAFQKLGIDIKAFVDDGGDAGKLMPLIADGMKKLSSDSERASVGVAIFGKNYQQLTPIMDEGSAGMNRMAATAHRLGIVISDDLIAKADGAADRMSELNSILNAQIAVVVSENAQAITDLAAALSDLAGKAIRAAGNWLSFRKTMTGIGGVEYQNKISDAYLNSRFDLSSEDRERARTKARQIIAQRNGLRLDRNEMLGGLLVTNDYSIDESIKRAVTPAARPRAGAGASGGSGSSGGGGRSRRSGSGRGGGRDRSLDDTAREFEALNSRLFPDEAALKRYRDDLEKIDAALKKNIISTEQAIEARRRLALEGSPAEFLDGFLEGTDQILRNTAIVDAQFDMMVESARKAAGSMEGSFVEAVDGITGALANLENSIRGGGFLSILSSVIGLGLQLGGAGLLGSKIASNINAGRRMPAYANGTNWHPGGLALVGEKGPEIVNLPQGSKVWPHGTGPGGAGGAMQLRVVPSAYFDVIVDQRIDAKAPGIATAGARGAMTRSQAASRRTIGA